MSLRRVTCLSRADQGLGDISVLALFGQASVLHRRHDLSGMLAFSGLHFFQVIEGLDEDVSFLLRLVANDQRHGDIRILCDEHVDSRRFPAWLTRCVETLDVAHALETALFEGPSCQRAKALAERILLEPALEAPGVMQQALQETKPPAPQGQ